MQPGQRVMFEHGSLHEVVDNEKEPCGCPPAAHPGANEFPMAQSEGLAPMAKPAPAAVNPGSAPATPVEPLVYKTAAPAPQPAATPAASPETNAKATPPVTKKKTGFFSGLGRFFRRIFGAE